MSYDEQRLPIDKLTRMEKCVAPYLMNGISRGEIAQTLGLSEHTVKLHARSIYKKTGVKNQRMFMAKYLT